jgi:hypothetical protein
MAKIPEGYHRGMEIFGKYLKDEIDEFCKSCIHPGPNAPECEAAKIDLTEKFEMTCKNKTEKE